MTLDYGIHFLSHTTSLESALSILEQKKFIANKGYGTYFCLNKLRLGTNHIAVKQEVSLLLAWEGTIQESGIINPLDNPTSDTLYVEYAQYDPTSSNFGKDRPFQGRIFPPTSDSLSLIGAIFLVRLDKSQERIASKINEHVIKTMNINQKIAILEPSPFE